MSDKQTMATVHYDGGDWGRNFTLAPGDVLEIKAGFNDGYVPAFKVTKAKVPEPQPEGEWSMWRYRIMGDTLMSRAHYESEWRLVEKTQGAVTVHDPRWYRMVADLKDATDKWRASK